MKKELPKAYCPKDHEDKIYEEWEKSGYFNPDNLDCTDEAENYSIVMPPPNVTGVLHMGHAAMIVFQDILIRSNRMRGKRTLWIPGTDHASIATTAKVEKILKEEGLTRHELGREKFLKRLEDFAQESHDTITAQIKKIGSSCDWSREAYTLDKTRSKAVNSVFKLMHDDGLIYRGDRIVNWCPRCQSTLADDEVEHKKQKTILYTFRYSNDVPFSISTTRPETKLGDTAIAVNVRDKRYNQYLGKSFDVNFAGVKLKLKVVADKEIDMNFGSGAVGITPAHSFTDWRIAEEQKLNVIKVINQEGLINEGFGDYSGLSVLESRELVVERLRDAGLIMKEEQIENNLSICYRCSTAVEPLPSLQWFINVNKKINRFEKSIKEICLDAVRSGVFDNKKIKIIPERFEKDYFHWMDNLRDWCISRQIWYGHRIPVWYRMDEQGNKETYVGVTSPEGDGWVQDSDTLDTWFSSGLWTFSTMAKNPDEISIRDGKIEINNDDFSKFHPTNVLETGHDILFFWVAKMVLMTTYSLSDIPFQDVYLHGLVLDEHGKKMSKSVGNTIDPLDTIEKYGTDATRLSLVIGTTPGNNSRLSEKKIANYRNFTNKLWNISRYIISNYDLNLGSQIGDVNKLTSADKWILLKLNKLITSTNEYLEKYQFSMAGDRLKEFCWNDLADWYLEVAKFEKTKSKSIVLKHALESILKLWHPFMPFVTEAIWKEMGQEGLLMVADWPTNNNTDEVNPVNFDNFETTRSIIIGIRNIRAQYKISPTNKIDAIVVTGEKNELINNNLQLITNLRTGIENIEIKEKSEKIKNTIYFNIGKIEIYLRVINLDVNAEKRRLNKEISAKGTAIDKLRSRLNNNEFVNNAPNDIIKQEREKIGLWEEELRQLNNQYNNL